ncbi:hypothetical protein Emag_006300 [Eimeria magna]
MWGYEPCTLFCCCCRIVGCGLYRGPQDGPPYFSSAELLERADLRELRIHSGCSSNKSSSSSRSATNSSVMTKEQQQQLLLQLLLEASSKCLGSVRCCCCCCCGVCIAALKEKAFMELSSEEQEALVQGHKGIDRGPPKRRGLLTQGPPSKELHAATAAAQQQGETGVS